MEGNDLKGIVSERDLAWKVIREGKRFDDTLVCSVMTADVTSIGPEYSLEDSIELMTREKVRHLPVVENDISYRRRLHGGHDEGGVSQALAAEEARTSPRAAEPSRSRLRVSPAGRQTPQACISSPANVRNRQDCGRIRAPGES